MTANSSVSSPFAFKKNKGASKKAFYGLVMFFCATLALAGYAVYKTFFQNTIPAVFLDVKKTERAENTSAQFIDPQPPKYTGRRRQSLEESDKTQETQKDQDSKATFGQAFVAVDKDPVRLKKKRTVDETLTSAFANRPPQQLIIDSASLEQRQDLPVAPMPASGAVPPTQVPPTQTAPVLAVLAVPVSTSQVTSPVPVQPSLLPQNLEPTRALDAEGKSSVLEIIPPEVEAISIVQSIPSEAENSPLILSVQDEFAFEYQLPRPDLIKKEEGLAKSLPAFGLIKASQNKLAFPLPVIDPLKTLQVESKFGAIPVIDKEGKTAFQTYSRPFDIPPPSPYVAILVTGVGVRRNATNAAINALPPEVSISFSPYADDLAGNVVEARKVGHETYLDLPMQKGVFPEMDPGPLGLVSGLPAEENRSRLHKTLGKGVAFGGLSASVAETFSVNKAQMTPFFEEIVSRGLIYITGSDDKTAPSFAQAVRPDILIADNFYRAALKSRLEEAKKIALKKGGVFVRVETTPISLLAVLEWINSFQPATEEKPAEITLVPLSYHAKELLKKQAPQKDQK